MWAFTKERVVVAAAYDVKNWVAGVVVSRAGEPTRTAWGEENVQRDGAEPWLELDRQLRSIASRRAALDHEELTLIREALRVQLWRKLGMASMREYLEIRMGYGPQVAAERLRVTDALEGLPMIEGALAKGELHYSAVRELTRIATCKTERAWLDACRGKNLRQIEELVAEREPGDGPTDRPKPDLRPRPSKLMLRPAARALMRQVRHAIANDRGEPIDDSELMEELCRAYLAGSADSAGGGDARARRARPPVQISITRCDDCKQARQHAAGRAIAITEAEYETAACDAVMIGSLDGAPERASSTIPPKTKRQVKQRDNYRCTVPWCRAAANIDVHHVVHREHGGGHEPENLTCLCFGHHAAHHRSELLIEGRAPALTFRRRHDIGDARRAITVPHVGESGAPLAAAGDPVEPIDAKVPDVGDHVRDALLALTTLGFKKGEAERALAVALVQVPPAAGLEPLLRSALRELR